MKLLIQTEDGWQEVPVARGPSGDLILEEPVEVNAGTLMQLRAQVADLREPPRLDAWGLEWARSVNVAVQAIEPAPRNRAERRAAKRRR